MDVYKCRFFPSGLVVLSGGMDMTVRIFAVDNGWNARTMVGHKGRMSSIFFFYLIPKYLIFSCL